MMTFWKVYIAEGIDMFRIFPVGVKTDSLVGVFVEKDNIIMNFLVRIYVYFRF